MKRLHINKNQIGDTIVEVMIAVAILGAVIGASFAIANRSLRAARQAQERGEALKIAERQTERIKQFSVSQAANVFSLNNQCLSSSGAKLAATHAECRSGLYTVRTTVGPTNPCTANCIFTTTVTWDRVGGGGQESVVLRYKAYRQ